MTSKASGHSALILATGLFVCFAQPSPVHAVNADDTAATPKSERVTSGKSIRHGARHWKRYAHRRYGRVASRSSEMSVPSETKKVADAGVADTKELYLSPVPASVANSNAQMMSPDAPANSAAALSAKANAMLLAAADKPADAEPAPATPKVADDQFNNIERTLQQNPPSTQTVGMASARAEPGAEISADDNDGSDRTSLIGKIFIGFGTLLTMASAARMLMV
jgi:hypothetical protein